MLVPCEKCSGQTPADRACRYCGFLKPDPQPAPERPTPLGAPLAIYFHPVLAFCTAIPAGYSLVPNDLTEAWVYRFAAGFFLLLDFFVFMDVDNIFKWCAVNPLARWINGLAFLVPGACLIAAAGPMLMNTLLALIKAPLIILDVGWYLLGFACITAIGLIFLACAFKLLILHGWRGK